MKDFHILYKSLRKIDWRVIEIIFKKMWDYKYVPSDLILKLSGIKESELNKILRRLSDDGLLDNRSQPYFGSSLTFLGMSLYSLRKLVTRNKLDMLGKKMGEGKESVVYNCYSEKYGECVIKFHKLGAHFRKIREKRDYGDLHLSVLTVRSAKKEYSALKRLFGIINVPEAFAWEGNAVMMELIDGKELFRVRLENPEDALDIILEDTKKMFRAGIIHGDLSQYNILVSDDLYIIDFPQHVDLDHENWPDILKKDIENVLSYFKKAYGIEKDINSVTKYIISE
ncbi:RIO-like serine/threonine protein kinase fused to N-terminal HTH domain protein [Archaeoglobus sulfaticallidus PM70-1]|uniref:non-specific serine/threonine protein kinase n=1 Tax=Archaeoglobus sulfaticallidus PM70-1 TaxID=387631 RepID=N0BD50_9EURY|nr:RIO1 family regulatory kinase/ATPase [Archaeoglobus sulfaticallidus]AGK61524.1 RIO-like serine/threonine protein kinase fused to N-terminal HTH domain protein [Archaeoglobus sulfaticallidus PM70-1]